MALWRKPVRFEPLSSTGSFFYNHMNKNRSAIWKMPWLRWNIAAKGATRLIYSLKDRPASKWIFFMKSLNFKKISFIWKKVKSNFYPIWNRYTRIFHPMYKPEWNNLKVSGSTVLLPTGTEPSTTTAAATAPPSSRFITHCFCPGLPKIAQPTPSSSLRHHWKILVLWMWALFLNRPSSMPLRRGENL